MQTPSMYRMAINSPCIQTVTHSPLCLDYLVMCVLVESKKMFNLVSIVQLIKKLQNI